MYKTKISLSDLKIEIEHNFDFMSGFCKKYISNFDVCDISVKSDNDAVKKESDLVPSAPIEVCESLCIYRDIAEQLPLYNRFVFHGAAIECEEKAYVFTAPSGTGKTTHINLWKKNLGKNVDIINGDKPIFYVGDTVVAYGTPWAGKEGLHRNASAPIKAICVLEQSKTNSIVRLEKSEAVNCLMRQVYMPSGAVTLSKTLELLGKLIEKVPVYMLRCDISNEAFFTAYNEMKNN